jgi:hypothetical protein
LDVTLNVAYYIHTSAGFTRFKAYSMIAGEANTYIQCYDTHIIPPNNEDSEPDSEPDKLVITEEGLDNDEDACTPEGANLIDFDNLQATPSHLIERDDLELKNT